MKSILAKIWPFIAFGIIIFILAIGFVILSYVLIFGAFIGLLLFAIQWLREKLSPKKPPKTPKNVEQKGRVIDHDDL